MPNIPLIVGVDVDEVCADLLGATLARYNADYTDSLTVDDIVGWDLSQQTKAGKDIYTYFAQGDLYDRVLPVWGAITTVNAIRAAGHRVVFVTSAHEDTMGPKFRWLRKWGFLSHATDLLARADYFPARDKTLIAADVLFDDHAGNVDAFPRSAFLVDHPHNRETRTCRPRIRFDDHFTVVRLLSCLPSYALTHS